MNEILKQYYNLLKNNWTIIALFPTLIGGLWQIIHLSKISVNMIRFFSISQLLSDGIIILIFLILMILFISYILFEIKNLKKNNLKDARHSFYIFISFILFIILLFAFSFFNLSQYITIEKSSSLLMIYVVTSALIYLVNLLNLKWVKEHILIINTMYVILYFTINTLITIIALGGITKNFNGIENFTTVITKIEQKDCYSKKPVILYFNDKHIFIELEKKNKKSVLIKKIEDLFEE